MRRFAPKAFLAWFVLVFLGTMPAISNADHPADKAWLDEDWAFRIQFTADPNLIEDGAHTDLALVLLIDSSTFMADVFTNGEPDGSDLVITAADGTTVLGHEVVSFDPVGETAEIWFNSELLSDATNTFYLYYGNPISASPPAPGAAWTDEHLVVYHFEEDPELGVLSDYGPNANHGTVGSGGDWTNSGLTAGQIGPGWKLDGTTNWMWCNTVSSTSESWTISAWFANSDFLDNGMLAFQSQTGFWDMSFLRTTGSTSPELRTATAAGRWTPNSPDAEQHHFVWSLDADADTARFFFDGVEQTIVGRFPPTGHLFTGELIGGRIGIGGPIYFNVPDLSQGILDEYCIAEGARDPAWIRTQFNNQSDPIGFFTHPTPVDPIFDNGLMRIAAWPNPFQGTAGLTIDLNMAAPSVKVYDVAGRLVRDLTASGSGLLRMRWDGRDGRGLAVGSGIYYVRAQTQDATVAAKVLLVR